MPATAPPAVQIDPDAADSVRRRLLAEHGLSVDAATARYLARRLAAADEEWLSFPAADADGGRWSFRVLPAAELRH